MLDGYPPELFSCLPHLQRDMASTSDAGENGPDAGREIRLVENPDGRWTSIDDETGVASQGETREEALANLDDAVALHKGEIGDSIDTPEEERAFLEELGIDPDEVEEAREQNESLPDWMA